MKGNFESIIHSETPVLIDFHAEWCGPCKMLSHIVKEVATEMGSKIRVVKIDVDKNPEISARYQIRSVPTVMLFKNGQQLFRQSGVVPKNQLIGLINSKL
jgi:thioredoxin 1